MVAATPAPTLSQQPPEPPSGDPADRRRLFVFLSVATFFEGYDYIALTQILPSLREEMQLSRADTGLLMGGINIGAIAAYLLIRRADVVGRRPMLAWTIGGYTLFSLLTALTTNAWQFGALQLLARAFLLAEYAISMVYATEAFPAAKRGLTIGLMQGFASLGSITCAGVVPMLLATPWGWRSVYVVGAAPLLLLAFARRNLAETSRFLDAKRTGAALRTDLWSVMRPPYRGRVLLLAVIWALTYMCMSNVVTFWKDFAVTERGFDDAMVSKAVMLAALGSLPCVFAAGKLLDSLGRHRGAAIIFSVATMGAVGSYTVQGFWPLTLALTGGIFGASAVLPVLTTYTLELFPTELRAGAFAWSNNLLGRIGFVVSPPLIGAVADEIGWGMAISATGVFPMIALALILTRLPETRGMELEDIEGMDRGGS